MGRDRGDDDDDEVMMIDDEVMIGNKDMMMR
jgi:hypothetical protein